MANVKTNAVRLLDLKKVDYILREYDAPEGFLDGVSVAKALSVAAGSETDSASKTIWSNFLGGICQSIFDTSFDQNEAISRDCTATKLTRFVSTL